MKPDKLTIYQLFEVQRRYVVPLFQRAYVWNQEEHWDLLWADLERMANAHLGGRPRHAHFLGAVVLNQLWHGAKQIDAREIIDGQQRITTFQLFLAAFRDFASSVDEQSLLRQLERLTVNDFLGEDEDEQFKAWPTHSDQLVWRSVMGARGPDAVREAFAASLPRLAAAYMYFYDRIAEYAGDDVGSRLLGLFNTLRDSLQLVVIDLDDTDDPQVIFETLNSRGVLLQPSDLIRNFLLHRARRAELDVEGLYRRHWAYFDEYRTTEEHDDEFWRRKVQWGRRERQQLDLFFFHYLQFRSGTEVRLAHLFREFCDWWNSVEERDIESELKHMVEHAKVFARFLEPTSKGREDVFLARLRTLETSTLYPLLLYVMGPDGGLGNDERLEIVLDLESYVVRRMVLRATSKNYNKQFMTLLKELKELGESEKPAPVLVRERLASGERSLVRWPRDEEMRATWMDRPAYGNVRQDRLVMILKAIELRLRSSGQEELALVDQVSLEHVMPQAWKSAWPLESPTELVGGSDETHEQRRNRLLHTIGNLTILTQSLNSKVSNGPYDLKRPEITKQSVLLLNAHFQQCSTWDEASIAERSHVLFEHFCKLWPAPSASAEAR